MLTLLARKQSRYRGTFRAFFPPLFYFMATGHVTLLPPLTGGALNVSRDPSPTCRLALTIDERAARARARVRP